MIKNVAKLIKKEFKGCKFRKVKDRLRVSGIESDIPFTLGFNLKDENVELNYGVRLRHGKSKEQKEFSEREYFDFYTLISDVKNELSLRVHKTFYPKGRCILL